MLTGIYIRRVVGAATLAVAAQMVWAQKPGPPSSGNGGNTTTPSRPGPSGSNSPTGTTTGPSNGNIYLSGKVMLDDGTPPEQSVTIERVCNGNARAQAYTDNKGNFSFQIGQTGGITQDASEQGLNRQGTPAPPPGITGITTSQAQPGVADPRLAACDIRAVMAGFRSDSVSLAGRHLMDDPNIGTIVLHRLGDVEGTTISMTSMLAPKDAKRAHNKARQDYKKERVPEAIQSYEEAVKIYPKYAAAWYELGMIRARNQDTAQARQCFLSAVAADARFLSPYPPLIEMAAIAENWPELAGYSSKLVAMDPVDYPMAYFYNATANMNLGQMEAAEQSARAGEQLDTLHRYPKLEQVTAMILIRKKDYANALEHMRLYLQLSPDADDATRIKKYVAELERLTGANDQAKAAPKAPEVKSGQAEPR